MKKLKILLYILLPMIVFLTVGAPANASTNPAVAHNPRTQLLPYWFPRSYPETLNISCTAWDDYGIATVLLEENSTGTLVARTMTEETETEFTFSLNTSMLTDEVLAYRFIVTDTDFLPHTTTSPWYYMVLDREGPTMQVINQHPYEYFTPNYMTYTDTVNFNGDFRDENEINSVSLDWSIDNWTTNHTISMPIYHKAYYWHALAQTETPIPAHPAGTLIDIAVTTMDRVNNTATHYVNYTVLDLTKPVVTVDYPPAVMQVNETAVVTVTITEPSNGSGISRTYLRYYPDPTVASFHIIPLTLVAPDQYQAILPTSVGGRNATVTVVAEDHGGNIYTESFSYFVTPTPENWEMSTEISWEWWTIIIAVLGITGVGITGMTSRRSETDAFPTPAPPIETVPSPLTIITELETVPSPLTIITESLPPLPPTESLPPLPPTPKLKTPSPASLEQPMLFCKYCGGEIIPENASFCPSCGVSLHEAKRKFCSECGHLEVDSND